MCQEMKFRRNLKFWSQVAALFFSLALSMSFYASGSISAQPISTSGTVVYSASAKLLFKSGFEPNVAIGPMSGDQQYIKGTDLTTGFSWDGLNHWTLQYVNNPAGKFQSFIDSVHVHSGSMALHEDMTSSDGSTRIQLQFGHYGYLNLGTEYYVSVWHYLPSDFTLEQSSNGRWIEIIDPSYDTQSPGGDSVRLHYRYNPTKNIFGWRLFNAKVGTGSSLDINLYNWKLDVPRGRWYNLRWYVKRGTGTGGSSDPTAGHVIVWLYDPLGPTGNTVNLMFDAYGNVGSPTAGFYTAVGKIYTGTITHDYQLWVDDIEIWNGIPTQS